MTAKLDAMLVTYGVAAAIPATMTALGAAGHADMPFWWEHDRSWVMVLLIPVVILYASAGIIVCALAQHWNLDAIDTGAGREWANGATNGLAAFAILGLGFTGFGLSPITAPRTILERYTSLVGPSLDRGTYVTVKRRIGNLAPVPLCILSLQIFKEHDAPRLGVRARKRRLEALRKKQRKALTRGVSDKPEVYREVLEAREDLRSYCLKRIMGRRATGIVFPRDVPEDGGQA